MYVHALYRTYKQFFSGVEVGSVFFSWGLFSHLVFAILVSFQKWDSIAAPKPISNEYFPTLIMFVRRSIEENQANISIHNVSFQL